MEMSDRLAFRLPEFVRTSWASESAHDLWAPRFARIAAAWSEIEWLSTADGTRPCALARMTPARFHALTPRWAARGVSALGLARERLPGAPYVSSASGAGTGQRFWLCVGFGTLSRLAPLKTAYLAHDDEAVGRLLGYPACCRTFFRRVWVDGRQVDTTWPMAVSSAVGPGRVADVGGPASANILLRWIGLRSVAHLPCSFDCPETAAIGDRLRRVGRDAGFADEMAWLEEVLDWPIEWSALHGIAEIKTPVLKFVARTDATATKYVVRRAGARQPVGAAVGLRFPYLAPRRPNAKTRSPGVGGAESWYWRDNGFSSCAAMDAAHADLISFVRDHLSGAGDQVLDLGCGNGALLKKLSGSAVPFGIDLDPARIEHAWKLLPEFSANFVAGDLFSDDALSRVAPANGLVLLGLRRLADVAPERSAALRRFLRGRGRRLIVYVYDPIETTGALGDLASRAGLRLGGSSRNGRAALAEPA